MYHPTPKAARGDLKDKLLEELMIKEMLCKNKTQKPFLNFYSNTKTRKYFSLELFH